MSVTNTYAAKRELLGAETQPLHSRSSCQGPGVILEPFLEDPNPNVLSGAHTLFYVWGPGLQALGKQQAEQQEHFLPCCQQTWKTTNCGAGRDCGSNLCTADWHKAPAPDTRASQERLYYPKSFLQSGGLCSCSFDSTGLTPLRFYSCFASLWNSKRGSLVQTLVCSSVFLPTKLPTVTSPF